MMKAAVIEKPGAIVLREVPQPQPGEYEALCELLYGATCTGTDLHLIDGVFPWPPIYPAILGHESIGRVIEVGAKVRNFKPGDLVTRVGSPKMPEKGIDICWGGFAEYGIAGDHWAMRKDGLPPAAWNSYRVNQVIAPTISPETATMMITWRETLSYITRMGVGKNNSLLVIGSGGNGLAFIAHAANLSASPVVMIGNPSRKNSAKKAGATQYLDYQAEDLKEQLSTICPDGFDFVIDALGRRKSAQTALGQVRRGGKIGIYGVDDLGQPLFDPFGARGPFHYHPNEYDEAETHGLVTDLILSGKLDASIWMDLQNPVPFEQINQAYQSLRTKEKIKYLIKIAN